MAKLWAVIKREYIERVRTKWFIIATVFGPLLFAALMIVPAWLTLKTKSAADISSTVIIDATNTGLGARVSESMRGFGAGPERAPEVRVISPSQLSAAESLATAEVMRAAKSGYLVLDQQTTAGESARYAGRHASSLTAMEAVREAVRSTVLGYRLEAEGVSADRSRELTTGRLAFRTERITDEGRGGSGTVSAFFGLGIAFLLYMSIILYGQNILRGVIEEKTTRVAEVVVSSVRPETLLAGKVLGVGAVGLTQQLVWVATVVTFLTYRVQIFSAFGIPAPPFQLPGVSPGDGLLLLLFFVLGFIFYASLFAAVGAMVNSDQEAQQAAQPVMLMLVAAAIFIQPVTFNPTGGLATTMSWLPFSSPIIMPLRLSIINVPTSELIGSLIVLLLSCLLVVWLAARIYRVGLLMYGKRPTLKELGHWIRYA
ncbi:MAG: ABC transporter permease [Gemmatimonadaceae bacterium]